ncbi:hypothetical protein K438DRAFT_1997912 [Mycena galopus ATCC 62051]|nr:hypothetical protein K438DRAFT_1997912 [Mycena galopus ATCC 62051]
MVRIPLGIPLVHHVNNNPKKSVTAVCVHTLDTLEEYDEGAKIAALVPRLMDLVWGTSSTPGLFELEGMQVNLRSKTGVQLGTLPKGDGSYNLASMVGEGEGAGTVFPALQTSTPMASAIIKELLQILHQLYRLIMPLCVSNFEWTMAEFGGQFNNVVAFSGLDPGPTGCQGNSSSAANRVHGELPDINETQRSSSEEPVLDGLDDPQSKSTDSTAHEPPVASARPLDSEPSADADGANSKAPGSHRCRRKPTQSTPTDATADNSQSSEHWSHVVLDFCTKIEKALLSSSIGAQGKNHGDFKDCVVRLTLFVLMFRLVPGSDLGPFIWNRGGIYLRELDVYIMFCAFRGTDIHSGYPPTYMEELQKGWINSDEAKHLFQRFGNQVRVGLVMYFSGAATSHNTQIQYAPSLRFLHSPGPHIRDLHRRYYALHGDTVLGNLDARANRLGAEGIYALKNFFAQCNLKLKFDVNTLLENTTYLDEQGKIQHLKPSLLDVENEDVWEIICLYMRYYAWLRELAEEYYLGITKPEFKARQQQIKDVLAGNSQIARPLPSEHKIWPGTRRATISLASNVPQIIRVLGRQTRRGEAFWKLIVEGSTDEQEVPESSTAWLFAEGNSRKINDYISKHGMALLAPEKVTQSQQVPHDTVGSTLDSTASGHAKVPLPLPKKAKVSGGVSRNRRRKPKRAAPEYSDDDEVNHDAESQALDPESPPHDTIVPQETVSKNPPGVSTSSNSTAEPPRGSSAGADELPSVEMGEPHILGAMPLGDIAAPLTQDGSGSDTITPTNDGRPAHLNGLGETGSGLPLEPAKEWSKVPASLFGLLPNAKAATISLKPPPAAVRIKNRQAVYHEATKCLCRVWEEHLILKPMQKVDKYVKSNEHTTRTRDSIAADMGELVHRGLLSVTTGFTLTDEEYENPALLTSPQSLSRLAKHARSDKKRSPINELRPTLETLIPTKPRFGIAAIIIREALSRK